MGELPIGGIQPLEPFMQKTRDRNYTEACTVCFGQNSGTGWYLEDHYMKRKDLLWGLAYPVYQIIGTIRHEGSHALAAMAEGAKVTKFVFWPNFDLSGLQWGYASWVGGSTWFTIAAPYFCDLITFFVALLIILEVRPQRRWLWLNLLIIGVVSPLVNSAYNYSGGLRGSFNDVGVLLLHLNPIAVHLYFAITLLFYAWGFYHCYLRRKTWHPN